MTDSQLFEKLYNGGAFSLPLLIKLSHSSAGNVYLNNTNVTINYNGQNYLPSTFDYFPPNLSGEGATLNISSPAGENEVFEFIELADSNYTLEIVATYYDGEVQPLKNYKHYHGKVNISDKGAIEFALDSDDRLNMTFTPYTYDTDNNKGNA